MKRVLGQSMQDRAKGCLFGAFAGDALGSWAEFTSLSYVRENMSEMLRMPGGGSMRLLTGQVTDDSEMAISLIYSLLEMKGGRFEADVVANNYFAWYKSDPFDIGTTTRNALNVKAPPSAQKMYQNVRARNQASESNGSLMRCTPHAVWAVYKGMSQAELRAQVLSEAGLTHYKDVIKDSTFLYVQLLCQLIKGELELEQVLANHDRRVDKCESSVVEWNRESKSETRMIGHQNIGWAKIAWTYSLFWLRQLASQKCSSKSQRDMFQEAMQQTLFMGGDTDTNACIVGGLVGAVLGYELLPQDYTRKLLQCKSKRRLSPEKPLLPVVAIDFIERLKKQMESGASEKKGEEEGQAKREQQKGEKTKE